MARTGDSEGTGDTGNTEQPASSEGQFATPGRYRLGREDEGCRTGWNLLAAGSNWADEGSDLGTILHLAPSCQGQQKHGAPFCATGWWPDTCARQATQRIHLFQAALRTLPFALADRSSWRRWLRFLRIYARTDYYIRGLALCTGSCSAAASALTRFLRSSAAFTSYWGSL